VKDDLKGKLDDARDMVADEADEVKDRSES